LITVTGTKCTGLIPILHTNTSIDLDLDIYDIEIDLFIAEFAEHFKVDNSKFSWYKYGYPKGSTRVRMLKLMFGYKRPWVKKLAGYCYKPKFKVAVLQMLCRMGNWCRITKPLCRTCFGMVTCNVINMQPLTILRDLETSSG
jgi:hypothetical protein